MSVIYARPLPEAICHLQYKSDRQPGIKVQWALAHLALNYPALGIETGHH